MKYLVIVVFCVFANAQEFSFPQDRLPMEEASRIKLSNLLVKYFEKEKTSFVKRCTILDPDEKFPESIITVVGVDPKDGKTIYNEMGKLNAGIMDYYLNMAKNKSKKSLSKVFKLKKESDECVNELIAKILKHDSEQKTHVVPENESKSKDSKVSNLARSEGKVEYPVEEVLIDEGKSSQEMN